MEFVLLVISFAVILAGALLFTNAIEWVGHKVGLGEGAVGSLLAAVGTALPETLIAIVALVGATKSEDVAIGAIVGAPFLLATLAMGLVGGTAYIYRSRRKQDITLEAHVPTLDRDLAFFMVFFGLALVLGFGAPEEIRFAAGIFFFVAYVVYVAFTIRGSGEVQSEESLNSLILARGPEGGDGPPAQRRDPPGAGRPRRDGRRRPPVRRGAPPLRRGDRRRGDRPLPDPRARSPPSCPRRSTASSGSARARTRSPSATSPARWSSSRRSPSGSA